MHDTTAPPTIMMILRRFAHRAARAKDDSPREIEFRRPDGTGHVEMPLSELKPGDQGHVLALTGDPEVRQHLLELGFTSGTSLHLVRIAPLSDPITVRIRGYQLSLRRREADAIIVRRCPPEFADF